MQRPRGHRRGAARPRRLPRAAEQSPSSHLRIGVRDGRHDLLDTGRHQRVTTRPGAPLVGARFKGDVSGGTMDVTPMGGGVTERHNFRVRATSGLGVSLAQYVATGADDDTADSRVGGCQR